MSPVTFAGWSAEYFNDALSFAISLGLLLGYRIYLRIRLREDRHYTFQAINRTARRQWVANIMSDPARTIVGIQTLRNSTMAATFFASTAVLLTMGTLTLSGNYEKLHQSWHQLNVLGSLHPGLWTLKVLFLLSDFLVAFFSFAMAVRMFHHVGYLLGLCADCRPKEVTPPIVAVHLNRAGKFYTTGMRAYFYSVPLVFWLFGPLFMAVSSGVLVIVLYYFDRAPRTIQEHLAMVPAPDPENHEME